MCSGFFKLRSFFKLRRKNYFSTRFLIALVFGFFSLNNAFGNDSGAPAFPKGKLKVGNRELSVEIAESEAQLSYGLMNRRSLPLNHGMIFIFPNEQRRSFWMKNTFINLSIGFFDRHKTLIDLQDMKAVTSVVEQPHTYESSGPAMYALEVTKGWFEKNGIKKGMKFSLERL